MELLLTRDTFTPNSTTGVLTVDGGPRECYVLEPPLAPHVNVHGAHAIPEGRYRLSRYFSNLNKRDVALLHDVPGFSEVEIHIGNFPRDTRGCLMPGLTRQIDQVGHSKDAFEAVVVDLIFDALDSGQEAWITVTSTTSEGLHP